MRLQVDGGVQHRRRTPTSCTCLPTVDRGGEVFEDTGLQVRDYADGGVRITVGNRQSTRAVLAALEPFASR